MMKRARFCRALLIAAMVSRGAHASGANEMEQERNYTRYGYHRVVAVSPPVVVGQPAENARRIIKAWNEAVQNHASTVAFPELSLTGYTAEDLFLTDDLIDQTRHALRTLIDATAERPGTLIVGAPIRASSGRLYNAAVVISDGALVGVVPKIHLPNYAEFYEKRWFESGLNVDEPFEDTLLTDARVKPRLSAHQLFRQGDALIGVEICEDLWAVHPPSTDQALAGANVIVNLSASNELVGKAEYRRNLVAQQSERLMAAYVYVSAGPMESTKDLVFGGHSLIFENGSLLAESKRFVLAGTQITADVDLQKLRHERTRNKTFGHQKTTTAFQTKSVAPVLRLPNLTRQYSRTPFVPNEAAELDTRSQEIIQIQATGLARRLMAAGAKKMVLGISGGLDSTLALLVAYEAAKILGWGPESIVGVTMPGFGTTVGTKSAAHDLMNALGVTVREISIVPATTQHLQDIGHPLTTHNFVYENAQARMRTLTLFDIANQVNGILVGTGDLSELCLGWCTFNGDQMANYGVNASIPKTLVKHLVAWYAKARSPIALRAVLETILAIEISPELLPPSADGKIQQKTEDTIGPYILHDFSIYHRLRNGFSVEKTFVLAERAFEGMFTSAEVRKWLRVFLSRFSAQQFKRTTLPPGPKVGSVSVSPRGDLRLPDEMDCKDLLAQLDQVPGLRE